MNDKINLADQDDIRSLKKNLVELNNINYMILDHIDNDEALDRKLLKEYMVWALAELDTDGFDISVRHHPDNGAKACYGSFCESCAN